MLDSLNESRSEKIKEITQKENGMNVAQKENGMNVMKNFNFGPCGDRAKISHLGIAVQNTNGEWVSYDTDNEEIVNVDLINFGCDNFVYMIPVAIKDVMPGDAIIHNHHVMYVIRMKSKALQVIDVTDGEIKKILPTKSIFGFDFVTKIVSLVDFTASTANEDNPFGNMLPFLLLGNNDGGSGDAFPLALMMMNGNNGLKLTQKDSQSMMLMAMLLSNLNQTKSNISEILPLIMLMQKNNETMKMEV